MLYCVSNFELGRCLFFSSKLSVSASWFSTACVPAMKPINQFIFHYNMENKLVYREKKYSALLYTKNTVTIFVHEQGKVRGSNKKQQQ